MKKSVDNMTTKELLAVFLDVDKEVVKDIDIRKILQSPTIPDELLSENKRIQLLAARECAKRLLVEKAFSEPQIEDQDVLAKQLISIYRYEKEENIIVVPFNSYKQPLVASEIQADLAEISPREIFKEILKYPAAYVVLAHRKLDGNLQPSEEDIDLTVQTCITGKLLDIPVIDHLILGDDDYVSMSKSGVVDFSEYIPE